ncbi:hypothetical protein HYPSUDRAFT_600048 [Hypholoma sublateritium FD-334 SS-4]|uniref:Uncharacterized protein n=1 Tax=Hypholoma sublateritium (strain FD-334 SS-4) TaxID=945553 RepID=A0A0D2PTQ3_HYPSF|nr:hypothetical protein HYPSUDRAFT_600048 [Hypholoma sublateritium FD-334 SS-4]
MVGGINIALLPLYILLWLGARSGARLSTFSPFPISMPTFAEMVSCGMTVA